MRAARAAGVIALLLHLALGVFPFGASGLLAPVEGVALLFVLWAVLLAGAVWLLLRRPAWTIAAPIATVVVWLVVVGIGDAFFGWTA
jgi:hypothetical protein